MASDSSLRTQLILLFLDKLVIGLILAGTFYYYDQSKTAEQQAYDQERRETDLDFMRADYVKELLPQVLDPDQDAFFRTQALAALIETDSISPESAVRFTQRLLLDDVLASSASQVTPLSPLSPLYQRSPENTFYPGSEEEFLLGTVRRVMPAGMRWVLGEYRRVGAKRDTIRQDEPEYRVLEDTARFWAVLFRNAASELPDSELGLLSSDQFLANNLVTLVELMPRYPVNDLGEPAWERTRMEAEKWHDTTEEWIKREVKGLRMMAAVFILGAGRAHPLRSDAEDYLAPMFNPRHSMEELSVGVELATLSRSRGLQSSQLALKALEFLLSSRVSYSRTDRGAVEEMIEAMADATYDYLRYAVRTPAVTETLEPVLVGELRRYANGRSSDECGPVEERLATILADTNANGSGVMSREGEAVHREFQRLGCT